MFLLQNRTITSTSPGPNRDRVDVEQTQSRSSSDAEFFSFGLLLKLLFSIVQNVFSDFSGRCPNVRLHLIVKELCLERR